MKTAYSYVRLSSKRQTKGSGEQRQMARAIEICEENGWTLADKTFSDLGVSAFTGSNRLKGDLGNFISLAKKHQLGDSPILILEQFDRFSRQDIDESEPAILDLLKSGVDIHVAFTGKTFTRESTKDMLSRIEILVSLKAAFDYSANLSKRIKGANVALRKRLKNGEIIRHRNTPLYYSFDADKKQYVQNEKAAIAKRVIDEYLKGKTMYGVATLLNNEDIPRIGYSKTVKWEVMNVKNILSNPSICGALRDNPNFYSEPLTDKATFDKIQTLLRGARNNKGRHSSTFINIFRGLARCPDCGGAFAIYSDYINRRTGKPHNQPYRYFRCTGVANGTKCGNKHAMNVWDIEEEFFAMFMKQDPETVFEATDTEIHQTEINNIDKQLDTISKRISKLLALDDDMESDEIKARYQGLKKEKETLMARKQELSTNAIDKAVLSEMAINFREVLEAMDFDILTDAVNKLHEKLQDPELRLKLRMMLPSIISKMEINTKARELTIYDLNKTPIYTTFTH